MNKDVIYIDVEDDVTAIIGKIKASKEKIVALVPPKRVGVLQSAVNLRLLARMAKNADKRMVLITNNQALIALSAAASIPVAKNLQSKPEIAEIPALEVDDGEDVIDGAKLPVGDHAKTAKAAKDSESDVDEAIDSVDIEDEKTGETENLVAVKDSTKATSKPTGIKRSGVKVPDFSRFRKRLFLGGAALVVLIAFLVWANIFAPSAKVIITAKTSPAPVSMTVTLGGPATTNVEKGIIQTVTKTLVKDVSINFTATGTKDVGNKATGTITITNCDSSTSFSIPANTTFTSASGKDFINPAAVTVPGFTGSASICRTSGTGAGVASVDVQADAAGTSYNIAATSYDIDGVGGDVYANGTAMTGGTSKVATVATAEDIQKAKQALVDKSTDEYKLALTKQFVNGEIVIGDSFTIERAEAVVTPGEGKEVTGESTVTSKTTFTLTAVAKSELEVFLKDSISKQIKDQPNQRIYDDGIDKATLSGYSKTDQSSTVNIGATGQVGPNIDKDQVKEQVKNKKYGEVQSLLEAIEGVSDVDVKFSYFWVTTVPGDTSKIDVEFKLQDASS